MTARRLLLSVFPTFTVGGAQMRFAAVANHFGDHFRHVIVALDGNYDCGERLRRDLLVSYPELALEKGRTFANVLLIRRFLRELRPHRLITHNWGSIEWAMANRWHGVAHIHIEDGFGPDEVNRQLPRRAIARRLALAASTVVVPSRQLERIALNVWRLARSRVCYVPNGIDLTRFSTAPRSPANGHFTIGTVAALRREKNIPRLIDAFRLLRGECRLIIVGNGPEKAALMTYVNSLGLTERVLFAGYRMDTENCYSDFDIFALSSDTEQMPTSVLEAMAAGLPVVSTDVGDVRSMISPDNLPFVVGHSAKELADAIERLGSDAEAVERIGRSNRDVATRNFSDDAMFATYLALFN